MLIMGQIRYKYNLNTFSVENQPRLVKIYQIVYSLDINIFFR